MLHAAGGHGARVHCASRLLFPGFLWPHRPPSQSEPCGFLGQTHLGPSLLADWHETRSSALRVLHPVSAPRGREGQPSVLHTGLDLSPPRSGAPGVSASSGTFQTGSALQPLKTDAATASDRPCNEGAGRGRCQRGPRGLYGVFFSKLVPWDTWGGVTYERLMGTVGACPSCSFPFPARSRRSVSIRDSCPPCQPPASLLSTPATQHLLFFPSQQHIKL